MSEIIIFAGIAFVGVRWFRAFPVGRTQELRGGCRTWLGSILQSGWLTPSSVCLRATRFCFFFILLIALLVLWPPQRACARAGPHGFAVSSVLRFLCAVFVRRMVVCGLPVSLSSCELYHASLVAPRLARGCCSRSSRIAGDLRANWSRPHKLPIELHGDRYFVGVFNSGFNQFVSRVRGPATKRRGSASASVVCVEGITSPGSATPPAAAPLLRRCCSAPGQCAACLPSSARPAARRDRSRSSFRPR